MKILLAPAWDHNFIAGPGRWLAGSGQGMTGLGDQDNYYPGTANGTAKEYSEPWWPAETQIFDPSQRFCWDADNRGVTQDAFRLGTDFGALRNNFISSVDFGEAATTKNRLRGTGNPLDSWNKSDTTFVDTVFFLESASGHTAIKTYPNHYQDSVHDAILQGSDPSDTTLNHKRMFPNKPGTQIDESSHGEYQSTRGSQYSAHWNAGVAATGETGGHQYFGGGTGSGVSESETYTYGYEFTLNVESVTHTWTTTSSVIPLPGPAMSLERGVDPTQLVNLSIDIGAMQEQISVKGTLFDGPEQPYAAAWEKPIRKQQLLDIIRGQWGAMSGPEITGHGAGKTMMQPNRFVALTIGPMHSLNTNGDMGKTFVERPFHNRDRLLKKSMGTGVYQNPKAKEYKLKALDMWRYGEEPSDDMRGENFLVNDADAKYVFQVWNYKFNYSGRRRYRGIITRVNVALAGGSPDVWDFSFEFAVIKNETTYRRKTLMTVPPPQEEGEE
jgi:hypothetical protein